MSEAANITSAVPAEQNIRDGGGDHGPANDGTSDPQHRSSSGAGHERDQTSVALDGDTTLEPVITITKTEATYVKGGLRLQQVAVTEDIPRASASADLHDDEPSRSVESGDSIQHEKETTDSKQMRTKIPMARLRKTVERVKKEIKEKKERDKGSESAISSCRKSSIPRLKDSKIPQPKEEKLNDENQNLAYSNPDEEFDRIFQDMSPTDGDSLEFVSTNLESASQVEMKFEEIIHDYEERKGSNATADRVKHSKIPLPKRKSEHEIEIPVNKNTLKKSQSLDAYREQYTKQSHTRVSRKTEITNKIYSQTADNYVLRSLNDKTIPENYKIDVNASKIKTSDANNNDNTVMTKEIVSVTSEISSEQNQEMNEDGNELDESISASDLTEVGDDRNNDDTTNSSPDNDDLISETIVIKNLDEYVKFDKETVSKIYKIDFTENCFDSIECSLKSNEVTNESANNEVFNINNNNRHIEVDTGMISKADAPLLDDDTVETKYHSTKVNTSSEEIKLESNDIIDVSKDIEEELTSRDTFTANAKEIEAKDINILTTAGQQEWASKYQCNYDKPISIETNEVPTATDRAEQPDADAKVIKDFVKHEIDDETYKIYSDVFTKLSAPKHKEYPTDIERKDTLNNEETTTDNKDEELNADIAMEEDITILKGKVSRIIRRISSVDNSKHVEKDVSDAPKKKSILTRIAMFEHDEPNEPFPRNKISNYSYGGAHAPAARRQGSAELRKPKIVRELLKDNNRRFIETTETTVLRTNENTTNSVETTDLKPDVNIKIKSNVDKKKETGKGKKAETNYKSVKDVINDIEAKKYTEYNNLSYEKYRVAKKSTINDSESGDNKLFKETNVSNKLKKMFSVEAATKDNGYNNIPKGSPGGETDPINNGKKNKYQTNSYKKIYKNDDLDTDITESETKFDLDVNRENLDRVIPKVNAEDKFSIAVDSDAGDEGSKREAVEGVSDITNVDISGNLGRGISEGSEGRTRKKCRVRDLKMVTSAESDLGSVTRVKVLEMVMRLNSMEGTEQKKKEVIDCKERPRKSSVSEKIALFEGRRLPTRTEKTAQGVQIMAHQVTSAGVADEEYERKIEELRSARRKYGTVTAKYMELSDSSMMPVMAFGTALLDKRITTQLVEAAIEMGFRAIDTASIYGNEEQVGLAISNKISDGTVKREELYVIAKLWSTQHRRGLAPAACRKSLAALRLAYIDLYLIHNPMSLLEGDDPLPKVANVLQYSSSEYMDAWYGVEDLVREQLVRAGGVSNFNAEQLERVVVKGALKPVVNQVESHPYLSQAALAGVCALHGVTLSCYGVLGAKGTPAELKSDVPPAIDDPLVVVMAAGLGVTPGQLLVAYQVNSGRGVVVKATSGAHLHEDLLAQHLQLDASHLSALSSLNRNKRIYTLKGLGETHRHYPFNAPY